MVLKAIACEYGEFLLELLNASERALWVALPTVTVIVVVAEL